MNSLAPPRHPPAPALVRHGAEARALLVLITLRWLAGVLENFGLPRVSEAAAITMLGVLGILFLQRMRLAGDTALFFVGTLSWFAFGFLSLVANPSADPLATVSLLTLLLFYGLFANASATYLRTPDGLLLINRFITAFIVLGVALSMVQVVTGTGFVEVGRDLVQRAIGSDVHPVSFAIQITGAGVALEIIRVKRRRPVGIAHVALMLAAGLALYLTLARTAWVMALLVVALAMILRGSLLRRLLFSTLVAGVGIGVLLATDRFDDLASLPVFLENFSAQDQVFDWRYIDNSVSWRIVNWNLGFQQALEQPWLGFGPGQSAMSSYFNLEMHNIFLEVFFEGGVFGLIALLITLAGLIRMHHRLPRTTSADHDSRILANGFGFSLFLAVTFSTSFVDQLMSFIIYLLVITVAATPAPTV